MSQNPETEPKIYEVTNTVTGVKRQVVGVNQQDCCRQLGWKIGDCFIVEASTRYKASGRNHSALMVKLSCQVCPFQYAECRKPADIDCPVQPNAPELQEWLKQAAQAHLCQYDGQELSKNDYHSGQKWLPMVEAIEELGDHH